MYSNYCTLVFSVFLSELKKTLFLAGKMDVLLLQLRNFHLSYFTTVSHIPNEKRKSFFPRYFLGNSSLELFGPSSRDQKLSILCVESRFSIEYVRRVDISKKDLITCCSRQNS